MSAELDPIDDRLAALRLTVEGRLAALLPAGGPPLLAEAVGYALLAPGKRSRPLVTLLCAERFGGDARPALDAACAFEMVHAASLVFDDLPCMDDAALRRGRETVHRRFGQDAAVLAGVTLLSEAFGVLARDAGLSAETARRLGANLSAAVGLSGLAAGQMRDLRDRSRADPDELARLNHEKTGVLFCAAAEAGARVGGASEGEVAAVCAFARHLGAAFQIRDDLLDRTTPALAGKDVGKDAGKPTFVSLLGVDGARRRLRTEQAAAAEALAALGEPGALGAFAERLLGADWSPREPALARVAG